MKQNHTTRGAFALTSIALTALALSSFATVSAAEASTPKPVDMKKPVKIYLLSGQSNMTGRANLGDLNKPAADQKATLVRFIMEPQNVEKYKSLYKKDERKIRTWAVRDDIFITAGDWPHEKKEGQGKHGGVRPGYGGFRNKGFGPELGIGHILGDFHAEPVLLVKVAFGANSLAGNFRPPSSGGKLGDKYPLVIKAVTDAIEHMPEIVPGYQKETGYEIAGFFSGTRGNMMAPPNSRRSMKRTSRISSRICGRSSRHPA